MAQTPQSSADGAYMAAIGRIGAHVQKSRYPVRELTAAGLRAAEGRFEREARERFPEASDEDIKRMAHHARQAHFARLSLAGVKARQRKRTAAGKAAVAVEVGDAAPSLR